MSLKIHTLRSFIFNTFWRRCFSFFDILVYLHIQKWGKKKNLNPTMAFGDSQLASAADSAKICSDWPGSAALVSKLSLMAIVGFHFFFLSPILDIWVDQNIKKLEASSSKGIRCKGTQCEFFRASQTEERYDKRQMQYRILKTTILEIIQISSKIWGNKKIKLIKNQAIIKIPHFLSYPH